MFSFGVSGEGAGGYKLVSSCTRVKIVQILGLIFLSSSSLSYSYYMTWIDECGCLLDHFMLKLTFLTSKSNNGNIASVNTY